MTPVPRPEGETERLEALRALAVLDTLPEEAYDDIARIAGQICDAPVALISLIDEDRQWFKSRIGLAVAETPRDQAFCAHAILSPTEVMVVEDARNDPRFAGNPLVGGSDGVRFYAGAPLVSRDGHALGTLCVIDREPRRLTTVQLGSLRALARQVVALLELRQLVRELARSRDELAGVCASLERQVESTDRDLHRAELIQRSLLPREAPVLPQCCLQSLYRPGHIVGGDLFDVEPLGERHVALVIADAAGHGLSAALLSVLFRERLRLVDADGLPLSPRAVLAQVNAEMRESPAPPGMFVTAVVCLLDLERREVVLASAGHPPVLRLPAGGGVELIEQTGPALGLFDQARFDERRLQLGQGDRLLLYTDGVLELDPHTPLAPADLGARLVGIGRGADAIQRLYDGLAGSVEREDRDDVTLLLIDLTPGQSSFRLSGPAADDGSSIVAATAPSIRVGETTQATVFVLAGRVTWLQADALLEAALGVLEAGRPLVLDLADCEQLDSTVLGTLHELAERADALAVPLDLQRVSDRLLAGFEELSLASVLAHVKPEQAALPEVLTELPIPRSDPGRHRERLLRAHEALAALSERNRAVFGDVIDNLRAD
jgi:serine phosphatase RsbU (regulator of sigma subunit)/anti-anti-sigma regulatory factor